MKLLQKAIRALKRQPATDWRSKDWRFKGPEVELIMPDGRKWTQPSEWAIRQWSNVTKRKLPADMRSKVPEVELRMPNNNPEPQLPNDWRSAEVELRMPVPSSQKLQTDAQKQTERLFNRTTGMPQRNLWQKITDGIYSWR